MLVKFDDNSHAYYLAPQKIKVGDKVENGSKKEIKIGNCMPLQDIPVGIDIHNVEIQPGGGGKIARSAGTSVTISGLDGNYSLIKLASGEVRKIDSRSLATIGVLSNPDQKNIKIGKAGRSRWLGRRPHTRGVVKNPVDHPHGGGEGKSAGGRHPAQFLILDVFRLHFFLHLHHEDDQPGSLQHLLYEVFYPTILIYQLYLF